MMKTGLTVSTIKATIFFEKRYWVATFERVDKEGYAIARHIFGAEPSDAEVHEFVLNHYQKLNFGEVYPNNFKTWISAAPKRRDSKIASDPILLILDHLRSLNPTSFRVAQKQVLKLFGYKRVSASNQADESTESSKRSAQGNGKNERNIKAFYFCARLYEGRTREEEKRKKAQEQR
ncbi:MAG: YjdF family protein [Verrucomicrobia bacterium]|nr:YjdF family protein [Verrucomicrobiota bacterium]